MSNPTWQSIKVEGEAILERFRELMHEGNVRRVVVKHQGRTVAEFPLTAGVVGVVIAPVLAAVGALVALLKECTIHVERETTTRAEDEKGDETATSANVMPPPVG
jgi:hypothetical protein